MSYRLEYLARQAAILTAEARNVGKFCDGDVYEVSEHPGEFLLVLSAMILGERRRYIAEAGTFEQVKSAIDKRRMKLMGKDVSKLKSPEDKSGRMVSVWE